MDSAFDAKASLMIEHAAGLSGYYIAHYEHELLRGLFLQSSDNEDIIFFSIKDVFGDVSFSKGSRNPYASKYYSQPIMHGNEIIGTIELAIDDHRLKYEQYKTLIESLVLALVTTSLIILVLILFIRNKKIENKELLAKTESQAQSAFLSKLSHEVRTPLNAILGFGDILLKRNKDPLSNDQKEIINNMLAGGGHILTLVDELQDQAKIRAGKIDINPTYACLKDILEESVAITNTLAEKYKIHVEICKSVDSMPDIYTDCTRLKQVMLNLITNGIKYNRVNGKVTIECHEVPGNKLRVSVTDTGRGITEEELEDLFRPYIRLSTDNDGIEGTGIGLTITKQIIQALGGVIVSIAGRGGVPGSG